MNYVVTAADYRFDPILPLWKERVQACSLHPLIYNLGGCVNHTISHIRIQGVPLYTPGWSQFRKTGYYQLLADGTYKSRAVHKPLVIVEAMKYHFQNSGFLSYPVSMLYLDSDCILRGAPRKMEGDWDVCVTVRPTGEQETTKQAHRSYVGAINAGVIWFNNTPAAMAFAEEWSMSTIEEVNDQRALNLLCQNVQVGHVTHITLKDGTNVRLMGVPTQIYNNYYLKRVEESLVVHLKGNFWQDKSIEELRTLCQVEDKTVQPEKPHWWSRRPDPVQQPYIYEDDTDLQSYWGKYRVMDELSREFFVNRYNDYVPTELIPTQSEITSFADVNLPQTSIDTQQMGKTINEELEEITTGGS